MFFKLKLLTLNIATAILLILFLCLGSQNLSKRYSLNLLVNKTVDLPIGFLIGSSFTFGLISGKTSNTALYLMPLSGLSSTIEIVGVFAGLIFFSAISWDFEVIVTIRKQLFDILENPFVTYILYDNIRICLKFYETCAQVH